jgi:hypothetical protein
MDLQMRSDGANWQEGLTSVEERNAPFEGQLVRPQLDRLSDLLAAATATPDALWMLVWHGFGVNALAALGHKELDISGSLTSSGRRYFLCRGSFESVSSGEEGPAFREPPSFWWPEDKVWFVSTDIDLPCTFIGGASSLIRRVLGDGELEAFPATLEDPVAGDPIPYL